MRHVVPQRALTGLRQLVGARLVAEPERVQLERIEPVSKPGYEPADMLITVKTYPAPSARHVETVCVAGVRLDRGEPEWVRLYPIAFRKLGEPEQFKKFQMVKADLRARGTTDSRPESHSPDLDSLMLGEVINTKRNWERRRELLGPLLGQTSTCELIRLNKAGTMADAIPSLGLIKPDVLDVIVKPGKPWTGKQLAKVKLSAEPDLFNTPLTELQPMAYQVMYRYRCESGGCPGHLQSVLDWELGVAGWRWPRIYGPETANKILEKWEEMTAADKDTYFFVGNQHQYRQAFSVLGVRWPKR